MFVVGVMTISLSLPLTASAQETNPGSDADLEEIVVTGSHIRRSQFEGSSPIQTLGNAEITAIGAAQPQDTLKMLTVNTGSELASEGSNRAGVTQFNLRGLGLASTLTLVNGRRAGVAPISDDTGSDFLDINQFPVAMFERIEVLPTGASATYGSEAVAGVVNMVTRKGFEGFEVSGDYREASNEAWSINLVAGKAFDGGSFNLYATYYDQTENIRSDFDWHIERLQGGGDIERSLSTSSTGSPGTYRRAFINADGDPEVVAGATRFADPDCLAAGGSFRRGDDGVLDTSTCRFSFADQLSIISAEERFQVFGEIDYRISDSVLYTAEAHFSHNEIDSYQGARFFANGLVVGDNAGRVFIPGDHPFNFFIEDPADPTGLIYIGPENWDNAIHTGADIACDCRPLGVEFTGRDSRSRRRADFDYVRMMNNLQFDLPSDWILNASHMYATGQASITAGESYRADQYNQALINGTFNPFGTRRSDPTLVSPKDGFSVAANTDDERAPFSGQTVSQNRTKQQVVDIIATGDVGEITDNPVGVAVGFQYRDLEQDIAPDPLEAADEAANPGLQFPTVGQQDVYALFAETVISITDKAELQLAARYEDFGGSIGDTTDPKVAIGFTPTEWLTLRGSWGTSFRAPSLAQTSQSQTAVFVNDSAVIGPGGATCGPGGQASLIFVVTTGGDLKPQSADNFNLGFATRPTDNFSLSVDYWNYDYSDLIAPSESAQAIIDNDCADDGIVNDPRVIRAGSGDLSKVETTFTNIGSVETDGFDIGAEYVWDTASIGSVLLSLQATMISSFEVDDGSNPVFDAVGSRNFRNNFGPQPEWRWNTALDWNRGIHSANLTVRYIDEYLNDQSNNTPIESFTTIDVQYAVTLDGLFGGDGTTTFMIGSNNLTDEDPPALADQDAINSGSINIVDFPGYDQRVHDVRGRIVYVGFKHAF